MASPTVAWKPESSTDLDAVREQLDRVLVHPTFRNSKRCQNLLRFAVDYHLQPQAEHLKERTIGVKVFGRDVDYDTNADPIVRATAGEVRKRIAQYYHEAGHETELRIDLPPGSYVPQFHLPEAPAPQTVVIAETAAPPAKAGRRHTLLAGMVAIPVVAAAVVLLARTPSAIDQFWAPALDNPGPILVCLGEPAPPVETRSAEGNVTNDPAQFTVAEQIRNVDHVALPDVVALSRLVGFLGRRNKEYTVKGAPASTLTDLRQRPTILIAGLDNPWTMRLTEPLRYHFVRQPGMSIAIEDRKDPSRRDWTLDFHQRYSQVTQDYAIVARFRDPTTQQTVVVAAGIGENGTIGAGEFLTTPASLQKLAEILPKGWAEKNVEVVLAIQVIDRESGPPRILGKDVW